MTDRDYLSPEKAAERLGWKGAKRGERLIRVMLAKERRMGRELMHRNGGTGKAARYGVTWPTLRRFCRELFVKPPQELTGDVRRVVASIEQRVEDIIETRITPQLEELRAADDELAEGLGRLSKSISRLLQKSPPKSPEVP